MQDTLFTRILRVNQVSTPNFVTEFNQMFHSFNSLFYFNQRKRLGRIYHPYSNNLIKVVLTTFNQGNNLGRIYNPYSNPIIKVVFTTLNQTKKLRSYSLPLIFYFNQIESNIVSLFYFNALSYAIIKCYSFSHNHKSIVSHFVIINNQIHNYKSANL